jgi:hypothetical protein
MTFLGPEATCMSDASVAHSLSDSARGMTCARCQLCVTPVKEFFDGKEISEYFDGNYTGCIVNAAGSGSRSE